MIMKLTISRCMLALACTALVSPCISQESYTINGNTQGFTEGAKVTLKLAATHEDKPEVLAETTIQNGTFKLSGALETPRLCTLTIIEPNRLFGTGKLMVGDKEMTVNIVQGVRGNSAYTPFKSFDVSGSDLDKVYREKSAFRNTLDSIYNDYQTRGAEIMDKVNAAKDAGKTDEAEKLMNTEAYKTYIQKDRKFFNLVEETMMSEFQKNGDSFWGPLLVLSNVSYFTPNDPKFTKLYEGFSEEAKNSFYGQILKKQLFVEGLANKPNPGFTLPDRDDKELSFAELSKGKKITLIDFWASWCNPCRKSIPQLKEIYKDFADKGLEIVSVSIDKKKADWIKALDAEQLPWPCVIDTKNVFGNDYKGRAVPTFILVDANGMVLSDTLMINDLRAKIESLISK